MAAQLSDDGTMDTVIRCSECGEEQRYNYDSGPRDEQDTEDRLEDLRANYPKESPARINGLLDECLYNEFVDVCLEDFESEHECDTK